MQIESIHLSSVDSTQHFVKQHLLPFQKGVLYAVRADRQTAGYGRQQSPWLSPNEENLYLTLGLKLSPIPKELEHFAQMVTYSLYNLLKKNHLSISVKWPNDLLLNEKKCAGILCETIFEEDAVDLIIGIGVNLNMSQKTCDLIDQPATSLKIETHRHWDPESFSLQLQQQFLLDLPKFLEGGLEAIGYTS